MTKSVPRNDAGRPNATQKENRNEKNSHMTRKTRTSPCTPFLASMFRRSSRSPWLGTNKLEYLPLKAAPKRIGLPEHPTPSSRSLAEVYYPASADIAEAASGLCGLEDSAVSRIKKRLDAGRKDVPFDIPHPSFKGPF